MRVLENNDIYARRGDSHGVWIDLMAEDAEGTMTPTSFEIGDIVRLSIKANAYDTVPLIQLIVAEFIEGRAHFVFEPEVTKILSFTAYFYDVQLERADGYIKTIIPADDRDPSPKFIITEEIT